MAGEWIKWVKGLAKRPEVLQMAHIMQRSRHEVAGLLCEFWEWADENVLLAEESATCPGFVRIASASKALVDTLAGADGFAEAMSAVGWLIIRDGSLEFPKFGRHNGKSAKRRALDAERKRMTRAESPDSVPKKSASGADKSKTREEKRREESKDNPDLSGSQEKQPEKPPDAFEVFWNLYPHRGGNRVGKSKTLALWKSIPADDRENLLVATRNYTTSLNTPGKDGFSPPARDPERFLKANWWRDWIASANPVQQFQPPSQYKDLKPIRQG